MNTPNFVPVINAAYRLTRAVRRVNSFTTTPFGTWVVVLDVDLSTHDCLVEVDDAIRPQYNRQRYVVPFGMVDPFNLSHLKFQSLFWWNVVTYPHFGRNPFRMIEMRINLIGLFSGKFLPPGTLRAHFGHGYHVQNLLKKLKLRR